MKHKYFQVSNKSFEDLGVKTVKELWEKVKDDHEALSMAFETEFTKDADSENKFHVIFSTANEDRHGEIVMQNWDLKAYKKNPVVLDSHNYDSIEHIIGKVNKPTVKDNKLQGDIEFMLDNPKGALAHKMATGGFLSATSVGFIPLAFDKKGNIEKAELLEISVVSVPANSEALFENEIEPEIQKGIEDCICSDQKDNEHEAECPKYVKPIEESIKTIEKPIVKAKSDGLLKALAKASDDDYTRLVRIAKELETTDSDNLSERKRKIYRDLRILLSKDITKVAP